MEPNNESQKVDLMRRMGAFLFSQGQADRNDIRNRHVGLQNGGKHAGGWKGHKPGMRRQNKTAN